MHDDIRDTDSDLPTALASWRWYDWVILVAIAGVGWGAVGAIGWLAWIEIHYR